MAPQTTLRSLLAHAAGLVARLPLPGQLQHQLSQWHPSPSAEPHRSSSPSRSSDIGGGIGPVVPYDPLTGAPSCAGLDVPLSCHNATPVAAADACCFAHPSGRLVLAQAWDEETLADGLEDGWTLRGLWPARCDGSVDTYCDSTSQFANITEILKHYGQDDLIAHLDRYWVASSGSNADLWSEQFNRHATCINTLSPRCYGAGHLPGVEVVDYLARAFQLFRTLDTFTALAAAGVEPDASGRTHRRESLRGVLERFAGGAVALRCDGPAGDVLRGVEYAYFVKGSLQSGSFVPARPARGEGGGGDCAEMVRYLPKRCRGSGCGETGEL